MQSDKEAKTEGKAIQVISLRLTSEKLEKLYQVMDKVGVGRVKDGDDRSEKLRNFIDKLHSQLVTHDSSQVTSHRSHSRRCYMQDNAEVSISEVCERCRVRSPEVWFKCPAMLREQGIDPKQHSSNPKKW